LPKKFPFLIISPNKHPKITKNPNLHATPKMADKKRGVFDLAQEVGECQE
jgi:hypothetical protein